MADEPVICESCDGHMLLAPSIGYYCETPSCSVEQVQQAFASVKVMHKNARYEQYLILKEEFDDERT